ncbi:hypothetical protein [Streptomyces sp. SID3343]|uniref:hypothetical protein n=1 Tax=Streptomyces sp. SID3343 TaxID=2690260 RepID=UPI00136C602D|nr:hypothetical protein [Streptomyces sp. SID3343]MYV99078.1 hypothetical protein [Streptomyces sp. SID3343]
MRHSPESADDHDDRHAADRLDERFRELVVHLAPHAPRPPVESVHRAVRRRRVRNRIAVSVAALVVLAGGVSFVGVVGDDDDAGRPQHEQAAAVPSLASMESVASATPVRSAAPSQMSAETPAATVAAATPLTEALFPTPADFMVVPGVFENWRVTDTRPPVTDDFGPCTSLTFSGLGAVEAQERIYSHDGGGGASVLLVRYNDENSAELAASDLRRGLDGACPATNLPNLDGNGRANIKSLDRSGLIWRSQGVVDGQAQYADYGVVRSGPLVAVVHESVIGPPSTPPVEPIQRLVGTLQDRIGKNETGP